MTNKEFDKSFKQNEKEYIREINQILLESGTNAINKNHLKFSFAWNTMLTILEKYGYGYVQNKKQVFKILTNDDYDKLSQPKEETAAKQVSSEKISPVIQKIYEAVHEKEEDVEKITVSVRMPRTLSSRIDKLVENSRYTKNQFIIETVEDALDILENMERGEE